MESQNRDSFIRACLKGCLEQGFIVLREDQDVDSDPVAEIEITSICWEKAFDQRNIPRTFDRFVFVLSVHLTVLSSDNYSPFGISNGAGPTFMCQEGKRVPLYFFSEADAAIWANLAGEKVIRCRLNRLAAFRTLSAVFR